MQEKSTVVVNATGLHARPASEFVVAAKKFESKLTITKDGDERKVNAKSIISLLSLGIAKGVKVTISADGADEQEAVDSLTALIDSGFGEE
ncbi:MAG: HPr family phosphocarrier protein [Synergistaceae bacterium]|jgi:phosphocarrier protein|nr:HPr family phosphocarrier protein [Synergistaceae bacterium]